MHFPPTRYVSVRYLETSTIALYPISLTEYATDWSNSYLLAEHGPGYSVEVGHTVLPKRLAMMLVRVEAGHTVLFAVIISYQNSNVEQHFFVSFFLLSVWLFFLKKAN